MVIADRPTEFMPAAPPAEVTRVVPHPSGPKQAGATSCLRCGSRMYKDYDDLKCVVCGYADYSYMNGHGQRTTNVVSSATRFVLRYVGDSDTLCEILAHARLVRLNNRAVYALTCPFCSQEMERSSLSGKRPNVREERFKCDVGHRVSLIPGRNGNLGWK